MPGPRRRARVLCPSSRVLLGATDRYLVEVVEILQEPVGGFRTHLGFRGRDATGDDGDALAAGRPSQVVGPSLYLHVFVGRYGRKVLRGGIKYVQVGRRLRVEASDDGQPLAIGRDADARRHKVLSHAGRESGRATLLRHEIDVVERLRTVAVYGRTLLPGHKVDALLRPLGRTEDLLVAVEPRYLSPFPLPKVEYAQTRDLIISLRADGQNGLLAVRREGEGRDAALDGS